MRQLSRRRYGEFDAPLGPLSPESDTPGEFALPDEVLDRFNVIHGHGQRIWAMEVVDQQSLVDLNGCSVPMLANLLGRTELDEDLSAEDTTISVANAADFPERDGVIRIGTEVIRYDARDTEAFYGCKRGHRADLPENGRAERWQEGETVLLEAAFQIATRPYRARHGTFVRYTNPYQVRRIADQGVATLEPDEFDELRPFVTAWSGQPTGDGWPAPQKLRCIGTSRDQSTDHLIDLVGVEVT